MSKLIYDQKLMSISDNEKKEHYGIEEIKNKVIVGDAFKVLKKIDSESVYI